MKTDSPAPRSPLPSDFSLILGGPLFQLMRRAHLSGDVLELLTRRIIVLSLLAWLPLLVLSIIEGRAWGGVRVPFLMDVDVHARFLLALPLFIAAELLVHQRMRLVVERFVSRGLVPDEVRDKFDAAIAAAIRLRNSVLVEVLLVAFVYGFGVLYLWRTHWAIDATTWYRETTGGALRPTLAGWWFGFVSLPMVQFIVMRWYFRLFIWARFLWHVSRIKLRLVPCHPDRAAGLGFVSGIVFAFQPLLVGQGVLLAGAMANKIFYAGAKLPDFKVELLGWVTMMVLFVLAPLLVFIPLLARTKRDGTAEFGAFAQSYVRDFEHKWLRGGASPEQRPLGSADIQSLADLSNSYEVVKGIKLVPLSKQAVLQLAVISLLPVAPLLLTVIPLGELVDRFLKIIF